MGTRLDTVKMAVKKRLIIKGGKVHSVGYRPFLMEKAQELKIPYFHATNVKDKEDGKQVVDVRVGGEEGKIDKFMKFAHENLPELAEVESITVEEKEYEEDIMTLKEFSSVFSALQLSKIVQAGLGMIEMQRQTLGKQDQTLEKQDQTIAIIKSGNEVLATKQDQMLEKQDQTISIIKSGVDETREFREENKTILQDFHHDTIQRFDNLDAKYGKIAENIEKLIQSIDRTSNNTERILDEMKEERKESRMAMDKILNPILKLAEKGS